MNEKRIFAGTIRSLFFALIIGGLSCSGTLAGEQLILSIAPSWNSSRGQLQLFEKTGGRWYAVSAPIAVLYGKNGLAWGRGLHGEGEPGRQKIERDKRAPAGVFRVGKIYTYDTSLPAGSDYPFFTVTENCAWPDDPTLPEYNRHISFPPGEKKPAWFEKQKMRHGDSAYRWLVEICHNSVPPLPGAGSAIFFHTRRGADRPSAGCTVMSKENLISLMRWLRLSEHPRYALLPSPLYENYWQKWNLPPPDLAKTILK